MDHLSTSPAPCPSCLAPASSFITDLLARARGKGLYVCVCEFITTLQVVLSFVEAQPDGVVDPPTLTSPRSLHAFPFAFCSAPLPTSLLLLPLLCFCFCSFCWGNMFNMQRLATLELSAGRAPRKWKGKNQKTTKEGRRVLTLREIREGFLFRWY